VTFAQITYFDLQIFNHGSVNSTHHPPNVNLRAAGGQRFVMENL